MDYRIVLNASDKEELNKLIDHKLTEGYLIEGGVSENEESGLNQVMVLSSPINSEMTWASGLKLIVFVAFLSTITSFITK